MLNHSNQRQNATEPQGNRLQAGQDTHCLLDAKFWGLVVMAAAVVIPAILPWLDRSPVKSIKYKGILSKTFLGIFVVSFFALCYLGMVPPTETKTLLSKIFTLGYFSYFLLMPIYTRIEKCKPVPERVAEA